MRRYPAFDPPEYVSWEPDPRLLEEYEGRLRADPRRAGLVEALGPDDLLVIWADLLRARLQDIALKRWVRTGVISKAWLGTGEEAVTVGAVAALDPSRDIVTPMIRNAGACPMMGMPLADVFRGYLATAASPSGGRDLHIGALHHGVLQPISHMGTNVPVIAGVALGLRARGRGGVALTWVGDGATRTGECHEGINFAAVRSLPVVYVLQNNQVALGTRVDQHTAGDLRDWAGMYGVPTQECDGNNVLDVYAAAALAAERCREGEGPAAVLAETFRMGGHATHDEREARETFPHTLFEAWGRRDPVGLYEEYLVRREIDRERLRTIEEAVTAEVDRAAEEALESRDVRPAPEKALFEGYSEGGCLVGVENRPI